jgi:hypothetical protein
MTLVCYRLPEFALHTRTHLDFSAWWSSHPTGAQAKVLPRKPASCDRLPPSLAVSLGTREDLPPLRWSRRRIILWACGSAKKSIQCVWTWISAYGLERLVGEVAGRVNMLKHELDRLKRRVQEAASNPCLDLSTSL